MFLAYGNNREKSPAVFHSAVPIILACLGGDYDTGRDCVTLDALFPVISLGPVAGVVLSKKLSCTTAFTSVKVVVQPPSKVRTRASLSYMRDTPA